MRRRAAATTRATRIVVDGTASTSAEIELLAPPMRGDVLLEVNLRHAAQPAIHNDRQRPRLDTPTHRLRREAHGDLDDALRAIDQFGEWVADAPAQEIEGHLRAVNEIGGGPLLIGVQGLGKKPEGLRQWAALLLTPHGPLPMLGGFVVAPAA